MTRVKETFRYLNSFATEQLIGSYISKVGPDIEVSLINGRYQINAGSVNYSYGPLHDAFRRYFNLDPPVLAPSEPILILGFGGGSVATILRTERGLTNPITGVELDEMMIRAGVEHFGIDKLTDLKLINADANEFILHCHNKFKLIVVDIYLDDVVPVEFQRKQFLEEARRCLMPDGKLVFNKLVSGPEGHSELRSIEGLFAELFPESRTFTIPVNKKMPNYLITGSLT
ncbi:MAG: methyltransferase domain-containing protein [Bacteroidales bacterium]|nr:methyltransferase domain-containing protein [Bacteroidales bacterium]